MSTPLSPRESHGSDSRFSEYPFRVFTLEQLGIDRARFLTELAPSFHALAWDIYDVRREQVQRLLHAFPEETSRLQQFLRDYWTEQATLGVVEDLLSRLPTAERVALESVAPYRRRAMARFRLELTGLGWQEERLPDNTRFAQGKLNTGDLRALPRRFAPMACAVVDNPLFARLREGVAELVAKARPGVGTLTLTVHQMSVVCHPGQAATNSPEGIHQDGADYIVSALVVERRGVTGGMSRVFGPDREAVLLSHTLQPGEGLFQADTGSPLWHDVTPVHRSESAESDGIRSILGFDIRLEK
nr:2OG-Fe dioxygenase family protein [Armatimonas sp.]